VVYLFKNLIKKQAHYDNHKPIKRINLGNTTVATSQFCSEFDVCFLNSRFSSITDNFAKLNQEESKFERLIQCQAKTNFQTNANQTQKIASKRTLLKKTFQDVGP